jgi:mono/diheme cytochrome c family protein
MNPELTQAPSQTMAATQPERAAVPVWIFVLLALLLFWGMVYFDKNGGWFEARVYAPYHSMEELNKYQPPTDGVDPQGQKVFEMICALCHNPDGAGKPNQAPPFVGSEWVLGSPARLVRIPLLGLSGPISVAGKPWPGPFSMPAMGASLSDKDLAAVLTYMRNSWGNKAPKITEQQVKAIKAKIGGGNQPMTSDALLKIQGE